MSPSLRFIISKHRLQKLKYIKYVTQCSYIKIYVDIRFDKSVVMDRKVKASLVFAVVFFYYRQAALAARTHYFVLQIGLKSGAKGQA